MVIWLYIQTSASMPGMWAASFMMAKHSRRWYSQSYKRVQVSIVKDPGHPTIKRACLLLSAKQYLSQGSTNYSHLKHCDRLTKPCLSQAWTSVQYNHTYKTAKTNQLSCSARDGHAHKPKQITWDITMSNNWENFNKYSFTLFKENLFSSPRSGSEMYILLQALTPWLI